MKRLAPFTLLGLVGCATAMPTAAVEAAQPVARAGEPDATNDATNDASTGDELAVRGPATSEPIARDLMMWDVACIDALLECADGQPCSPPPPPAVDEVTLRTLLTTRPRNEGARRTTASAARAAIEGALAADAFDRHARRRSLSFVDAGADAGAGAGARALFAYDDVGALLAQAKRSDRARVFAAARTGLERSVDIAAEERALLDAAASRAGVSRAQLLAKRAGLDEPSLRALVAGALAGTATLLTSVASDVTLLADVRALSATATATDAKAVRALVKAARSSADPILVETAARAALAPRRAEALIDWSRVLAVDVRAAALSVQAILDGADADARDALASRILSNDADVVRGAGALLTTDEGGVVIERFVALLSTPALTRDLRGGVRAEGQGGWIRAWLEAPPLEERGHPEAFIEVLKILPELAAE